MDFVVQHALDNVWAESVQDKDYYIRPARITPNGGSLKYAEVGINSVALPNANVVGSKTFHHVYHIGQLPPHLLGIDIAYFDLTNYDYIRLIPHGRSTDVGLTQRQYMFVEQVCEILVDLFK